MAADLADLEDRGIARDRMRRHAVIDGTRYTDLVPSQTAIYIAHELRREQATIIGRTPMSLTGFIVVGRRHSKALTALLALCGIVPALAYLSSKREQQLRFSFTLYPEGGGTRVSGTGEGLALDVVSSIIDSLP